MRGMHKSGSKQVSRRLSNDLPDVLRKAGGVGKILENTSGIHARSDRQNAWRTVTAAGVGLYQAALSGQAKANQCSTD